MKIIVLGDADDERGAILAGASFSRTLEEALAEPDVGLIFARDPDPHVIVLPEGGSNAAAGEHRGRVRRRP